MAPQLRFPRTSESRNSPSFHRLLTAVDLYAPRGLQFKGQALTPGAAFDPGDLPRPAVLLEFAGRVRIAPAKSRYSFAALWLLWRFDFESQSWVEVVRTHSNDASWTVDFAPIAARLLDPEAESEAAGRATPVIERIAILIAAELAALNREVRCYALAGLEQYLVGEIARTAAPLSILKIGFGSEAKYPAIGSHPGREPGVLMPRSA